MYPVWVYVCISVAALWLAGISYFVWRQQRFLRDFIPTTDDKTSLLDQFSRVIKDVADFRERGQQLQKNVRELSLEGLKHTQKISLLRYNPYGDTGGDQSFTLVLLSGNADGVLVTSLHTRAGTRIYAKEVKNGQCEMTLSKEEQKALDQALQHV